MQTFDHRFFAVLTLAASFGAAAQTPITTLPAAPTFYAVHWPNGSHTNPDLVSISVDPAMQVANMKLIGPIGVNASQPHPSSVAGLAFDRCGRLWAAGDGVCSVLQDSSPWWHHNSCLFEFVDPANGADAIVHGTLTPGGLNIPGCRALAGLEDGDLLLQMLHTASDITAFDPRCATETCPGSTQTIYGVSGIGEANGLAYSEATPGFFYAMYGDTIHKVPLSPPHPTATPISTPHFSNARCLTASDNILFTITDTGSDECLESFYVTGTVGPGPSFPIVRQGGLVGHIEALALNRSHDLGGASTGTTSIRASGGITTCLGVEVDSPANQFQPGAILFSFVSTLPIPYHYLRTPLFGGEILTTPSGLTSLPINLDLLGYFETDFLPPPPSPVFAGLIVQSAVFTGATIDLSAGIFVDSR